MKNIKVFIFGLVFMFVLAACGGQKSSNETGDTNGIEPIVMKGIADFSFTTQDNDTLSLDDLKGKWWIADFVFTNCTTVCLPMTSNMSALQDRIKEERLDVQLVTFTVDPARDTAEVLKEYGEEYDADFDSWTFLTGYDFETITELSTKSFLSSLQPPREGSDQITHGIRFHLVNPKGEMIKYYDGVNFNEIETIIEDLKKVD
ncbi:cytochrome c oxidase assembly protein [Ammoniphilus oxalaticus]|uniref:Cytochrome c oxidase assembly protein n=1 Tax=Ammoniphilus oxalaticus TaxID=66863 RepID=A0A419SGK6_9BACL|nr:SCO family protein [Ammoniphilus oxalaticus]RKD22909.1 cytochrome c oxidase assembly protein [Ammoniphilus oxalaticus]